MALLYRVVQLHLQLHLVISQQLPYRRVPRQNLLLLLAVRLSQGLLPLLLSALMGKMSAKMAVHVYATTASAPVV